MRAPPTHLPGLDGLRGVAALIVVVSHSSNFGLLPAAFGRGFGQIGVAIFFVLSGFLMGYLYAHKPPNRAAILRYLQSRAARVLPLYFIALTLAGLLVLGFGLPLFDIPDLRALLLGAGLIHAPDIFWSIPVEVQFYLVFALVWLALGRGWGVAAFALVTAALAIGAWLLPQARYVLPKWGMFFVAGTLAAMAYRRWVPALQSRLWHLGAWLTLPALIWVLPGVRRAMGQTPGAPYADPATMLWVGAVFFCALLSLGPYRALAHPALRWLGAVSFSLYLLHLPLVVVTAHLYRQGHAPAPLLFAGLLVASLCTAFASLHLIERPAQRAVLRRAGHPRTPR